MTRTQLKLAVLRDDLPVLRAALESAGVQTAGEPSVLTSAYYDSADHKLRQQALSFCVQEQDNHHIQSLRGNDAAADSGTFGEWRDTITGERPDPTAPETGPRLRAIIEDELRPLFKIQIRRTLYKIDADPSIEIVAALDEGDIRAADSTVAEPLCELELELKRGDPAALYDIALQLSNSAPLRIETQSHPEQGYRLSGAELEPVTAKPLALKPSMTVEAVLQDVGRECLRHLLRNEADAVRGDPEAFHQMRVAVRRLRSMLSALRPMLPADHYQRIQEELKWLMASLGPVRDWDVFATDLLASVKSTFPDDVDLSGLAEAAKVQRRVRFDVARETLISGRYAGSMLRLKRWFEIRGWREQPASKHSAPLFAPIIDIAPELIERRWRQVRKRTRHFVRLSTQGRHEARIGLKKLRYLAEFLGSLFEADDLKAFMKRLKPLQEGLGHVNDVSRARRLVKEIGCHLTGPTNEIGQEAGLVLGWHMHGIAIREQELVKLVRRLKRTDRFWTGRHPEADSPGAHIRDLSDTAPAARPPSGQSSAPAAPSVTAPLPVS